MFNQIHRRGLSTLQIVLIIVAAVVVLSITCAGLLAALALPAIATARNHARGAQSTMHLQQFEFLREDLQLQAASREGAQGQLTIEQLLSSGNITSDMLESPFGPVSDGLGDYWLDPTITPENDAELRIASYDRAMYESASHVAVCFYLEGCQTVPFDEFAELLALPVNAETDFNLPARLSPAQ